MSSITSIPWTDHTFNPWWGCEKIDPGCTNCYAAAFSARLGKDLWGVRAGRQTFGEARWELPFRWERSSKRNPGVLGPGRPHLVFCGSMCDWAEDHPVANDTRPMLWELIRATPNLTWQLLTKRADRLAQCLPADWGNGYPNVWLGVSVSEPNGLWRSAGLLTIPAAVRFLSYEPALGDITHAGFLRNLDWIIFGGESGPNFRAPDGWLDWARRLHFRCVSNNVPFFFKQSPGLRPDTGTTLDGHTIRQFPDCARLGRSTV